MSDTVGIAFLRLGSGQVSLRSAQGRNDANLMTLRIIGALRPEDQIAERRVR